MSSDSSNSHHRHKKRKHRQRHRSSDTTSLLKSIHDKMQSISKWVTRIEGLTTSNRPVHDAQSDSETSKSSGEQRLPPVLAASIANPSIEEQSPSVTDTQLAGDQLHGTWGDRNEQELPDYDETIYWEPEPDSDDPDTEIQKLSPTTTSKIIEDTFAHSITNNKRRGLKRKQLTPDTPYTKCPKLDPAIQSRLPKQAKDVDRNLTTVADLGGLGGCSPPTCHLRTYKRMDMLS